MKNNDNINPRDLTLKEFKSLDLCKFLDFKYGLHDEGWQNAIRRFFPFNEKGEYNTAYMLEWDQNVEIFPEEGPDPIKEFIERYVGQGVPCVVLSTVGYWGLENKKTPYPDGFLPLPWKFFYEKKELNKEFDLADISKDQDMIKIFNTGEYGEEIETTKNNIPEEYIREVIQAFVSNEANSGCVDKVVDAYYKANANTEGYCFMALHSEVHYTLALFVKNAKKEIEVHYFNASSELYREKGLIFLQELLKQTKIQYPGFKLNENVILHGDQDVEYDPTAFYKHNIQCVNQCGPSVAFFMKRILDLHKELSLDPKVFDKNITWDAFLQYILGDAINIEVAKRIMNSINDPNKNIEDLKFEMLRFVENLAENSKKLCGSKHDNTLDEFMGTIYGEEVNIDLKKEFIKALLGIAYQAMATLVHYDHKMFIDGCQQFGSYYKILKILKDPIGLNNIISGYERTMRDSMKNYFSSFMEQIDENEIDNLIAFVEHQVRQLRNDGSNIATVKENIEKEITKYFNNDSSIFKRFIELVTNTFSVNSLPKKSTSPITGQGGDRVQVLPINGIENPGNNGDNEAKPEPKSNDNEAKPEPIIVQSPRKSANPDEQKLLQPTLPPEPRDKTNVIDNEKKGDDPLKIDPTKTPPTPEQQGNAAAIIAGVTIPPVVLATIVTASIPSAREAVVTGAKNVMAALANLFTGGLVR